MWHCLQFILCTSFIMMCIGRLQNSPYFWVFKYAGAVKQKVWNEAENREQDWGGGRVTLARFARKDSYATRSRYLY